MADDLDSLIDQWRRHVSRERALAPADVDELEAHLRDEVDALEHAGLTEDEAFLVGVRRLGRVDVLSREFASEHSGRLWKQLMPAEPGPRARPPGLALAIVVAVLAALWVKVPALLGADPADAARFASILFLAPLAAYFLLRRRAGAGTLVAVAAIVGATAAALAFYPFAPGGQTEVLAALHAVVVVWMAAGVAYASGDWRSERARVDLIRFTGEWVVYMALLALGGAVLIALTLGVFGALGVDAEGLVGQWLVPCGAAGAVVVAAWLVEAKQSVVENMAPVLTRVFSPLFTALLVALLVAVIMQGDLIGTSRDLLLIVDLVLIVVLGLLLYALSAREPGRPATWFDRLQLVMLVTAVVVDVIVLVAVAGRIGVYGLTANKAAALGLNLVLLVNLLVSAVLQGRFAGGRIGLVPLQRWQTGYLPVFFLWAAAVVLLLPPAFGFS